MGNETTIRLLTVSEIAEHADTLGALLLDALEGDASIGFMGDLTARQATDYWRQLAAAADGRAVLVAGDAQGLAGMVMLVPNPNTFQPHRADIAKMVVHRRARGRGLAKALMGAAEQQALAQGRTVLTLMTRHGSDSEHLYRKLGWQLVGVIPDDSLQPDGALCDGALYVKKLA
jgi:GNAT superfamily N-acetyltransferase